MSTRYLPLKPILTAELFDGRLERFGVHEFVDPEASDGERHLTDGEVCVSVFGDDHGLVADIVCCDCGGAGDILDAVGVAFDTDLVSEDDLKYWDAWSAASDQGEKNFVQRILGYVRGDPNDSKVEADDMLSVQIAKKIVERDPSLALPGRHSLLYDEIQFTLKHTTLEKLHERLSVSGSIH
jgi:hypothetical protein